MIKFVSTILVFTSVFALIECLPSRKVQSTFNVFSMLGNQTSAPFNEIVGYASTNVEAYSNGNDTYTSPYLHFLYGVYTGIKWQCVEYARRWLFVRKGCVFDSIEGAADMWTELDSVQRVVDKQCFPLKKYPNGSPSPPKNESLLIYNRSGVNMPYGHVAVIVDVLASSIRVAEENYHPNYWVGNYSREIPYRYLNGSYYIEDQYPILGWMVVEDGNQTKPLDQTTILRLNGSSPDFVCHNHANWSCHSYLLVLVLYLSYVLRNSL